MVGADRQLAVATVDQHGQPDSCRPANIYQRIHRGTYGPTCVKNVVDDDDGRRLQCKGDVRATNDRLAGRSAAEVVTVEGDVELADRRPHALVLADRVCQTLSQGHAPA